jgi:hypothetical protein
MTAAAGAPPASDARPILVPVGEEPFRLELELRRFGPEGGAVDSVLLLHGANTSGDTFLEPNGGFVRYLVERGRQVWLLEWRGSPRVVGKLPREWLGGSAIEEIRHYTVDDVAREDLPATLKVIRGIIGPGARLSIVGHCVGGGALAIAIAEGRLEGLGVEQVVLSTLGLFYEVPWAGWIKAEDFLLERVLHDEPECGGLSPGRLPERNPRAWPWPRVIERAYAGFPGAWLPADGGRGELFRRLAFMIGQPYSPERLDPSLRDGRRTDPIFGPLHMGLYLHVGQMARRGYAAPLDAPDVIDRTRLDGAGRRGPAPHPYLKPGPFRRLETTLLCATENAVWHRDAVDLMHEWLRNHGARSVKRVFPGYDIQELFWGERAEREVYPVILRAL